MPWKGATSVNAIAEIKPEMPFFLFGFARVTEVRHIYMFIVNQRKLYLLWI